MNNNNNNKKKKTYLLKQPEGYTLMSTKERKQNTS